MNFKIRVLQSKMILVNLLIAISIIVLLQKTSPTSNNVNILHNESSHLNNKGSKEVEKVASLSTGMLSYMEYMNQNNYTDIEVDIEKNILEEGSDNKKTFIGNFIATGYNLSAESTGKSRNHPAYGITANGFDLTGHTRESAMVIATDTNIIPFGTKVYLLFGEGYEHLSGVYTSKDKGGAIKGNTIDVFMGDNKSNQDIRNEIGRQEIEVYLIKE